MYCVRRLNKKNIQKFKEINKNRNVFNDLNMDFFDVYNNSNFTQKFFERRNVKLVFQGSKIVGYGWYTSLAEGKYNLNSLYVDKDDKDSDYIYIYKLLTLNLKNKASYLYTCETNSLNNVVLERLNFIKGSGTVKMIANIYNDYSIHEYGDITFKILEKNKDEKLRCYIQNEIFRSDSRVPLTEEDMYFDEVQDYYIDLGAVFIKYKDKYIGYGQFILDEGVPVIVNFGLLNDYRGYGYSKLLLRYILTLIGKQGYDRVYIKVNADNVIAINLYASMNFKVISEIYNYILKK